MKTTEIIDSVALSKYVPTVVQASEASFVPLYIQKVEDVGVHIMYYTTINITSSEVYQPKNYIIYPATTHTPPVKSRYIGSASFDDGITNHYFLEL